MDRFFKNKLTMYNISQNLVVFFIVFPKHPIAHFSQINKSTLKIMQPGFKDVKKNNSQVVSTLLLLAIDE